MAQTQGMSAIKPPTWDDVRRIRDELKAKMQHASTEAKERWAKLQPSIREAEDQISKGGSVVVTKLTEIGAALKEIGRDVAEKLDHITHEKPPAAPPDNVVQLKQEEPATTPAATDEPKKD